MSEEDRKRRRLQVLPSSPPTGSYAIYIDGACIGFGGRAAIEKALVYFDADFDPTPFGAAVDEGARAKLAEIEKWCAERDPSASGRRGWAKTQENRIEPFWRGYVRGEIVARGLTAASNADIYRSFAGRRGRGGRWSFMGRKCPSRSIFMEFLKAEREAGRLPRK
jgi:hypothetical protein